MKINIYINNVPTYAVWKFKTISVNKKISMSKSKYFAPTDCPNAIETGISNDVYNKTTNTTKSQTLRNGPLG